MNFEVETLDSMIPIVLVGLFEAIDLQIDFRIFLHEADAGLGLVNLLLREHFAEAELVDIGEHPQCLALR